MLKKIKIKLEALSVKHKTVNNMRTNKAQLVEALGCRAEDLSLIFRTHKVAGENRCSYYQKLSS